MAVGEPGRPGGRGNFGFAGALGAERGGICPELGDDMLDGSPGKLKALI